jgi:nitronate monooxygenase/enoyl-[acyl-carrier protein] reductase II
MSTYTSPRLAAAVSNAGALGSLGVWQRPVDECERDLAELRDRTDRPFAVNHVVPAIDDAAFDLTLAATPAVVAFALDDAGPWIDRVHAAGCLAMQQVTTVDQAKMAAAHGTDIIVAQGGEAGGYGGTVSTLALVPQVVDAVRPVPVVAAGGIADGRGLAAALVLGAAGVNLGSRFLASQESPVTAAWKRALVDRPSQDWIPLEFFNDLNPNPGRVGYGTRVRGLRTEFTERWEARRDDVRADPAVLLAELQRAAEEGRLEELVVIGGQSAGLLREVEPAAAIVHRLVEEAEAALRHVAF